MTPFRRILKVGMSGRDVVAVKRTLKQLGYAGGITLVPRFGNKLAFQLRRFQHAHSIEATGNYGPKTHAKIAPHFDAFSLWLYTHGPLPPVYVNPFHRASTLRAGRIDQGVDYFGVGPICAIGDAEIIGDGGGGWPGGHYLLYKLLAGRHAGKYVYVAEAIIPKALPGTRVNAGDVVAEFGPNAAPGKYPGIETGWGSPTLNLTRAKQMGDTGGANHSNSPAGLAFARFLKSLGTPVSADPGSGPEYV